MTQSRKRKTRTQIVLAAATASVLAGQVSHAAKLTLYYGQDTNYANSNNGIFVGSTFVRTGGATDAVGETQGLSGKVFSTSVSSTTPTTIVVPLGGYLSLAIDAVLTGNFNPFGGISTAQSGQVQPSFLGLDELGIAISSSDSLGVTLTPLSSMKAGHPDTSISGIPSYNSTAVVNQLLPANGGASIAPAPAWPSKVDIGQVQPNLAGYDTAPNTNGGVGFDKNLGIVAGSGGINGGPVFGNSSANINSLEQFTTQSNVAAYSNATDFQDNVIFWGSALGTVTLAPVTNAAMASYWTPAGGGTSDTPVSPIKYTLTHFVPGDVIVPLPKLVVQIAPQLPHPIITLSAGPGIAPEGYGTLLTNGAGVDQGTFSPVGNKLAVTGSNGKYLLAQVTGIDGGAGASTDSVEAATFNPTTDEEVFALDVLVNGTQATAAQLATLVEIINSGDPAFGVTPSPGVFATTSAPAPDPFPQNYNLFLDPTGFGDVLLGIDMSSNADPNLVGYTFSSVAVVPEPTSLGILSAGAIGLSLRRRSARSKHS